ncbi:Esterase E4 [Orchesella cincta]|uniref:Esterase E4 n=1 Tax=Orchesella cincta TaxID=48709 RepID=A0A1D2M4W4_ORCCI|nr:Esterase E4 [Orchesella cincta]
MRLLAVNLLFAIAIQYVISAAIEPLVEIKQGKLKGKLGESRNGRKFVQYLGIPYAQKPQRFQEAVPPEKWERNQGCHKIWLPMRTIRQKDKRIL